jgi:hypothetical protein
MLAVPTEEDLETGSVAAWTQLLELMLGCAVQCKDKEKNVLAILALDEDTKTDLMASIQRTIAVTAEAHAPGGLGGVFLNFVNKK